jgi:hypothetical protein
VTELDVLPGVVGLKIGWANEYGRRIVGGPCQVKGAVEGILQRGVIEGIVLGVAADADVRLDAAEVCKVVQENV